MPLTLADARKKVTILTTVPADLAAIPLTALTSGIEASCKINKPDYRLSPTASDTVPDQPLCAEGNATTFGNSNFEGSITSLRFLDATGKPETAEDEVYDALRVKGSRVVVVERTGPKWDEPWAAGDIYRAFEVITDNPQEPQDMAGYIKNVHPLGVQNAVLHGVVAAGA